MYSAKSAEGSDISELDIYIKQLRKLAKQASMQHVNVDKYTPAGMKWRNSNATIHGVSVTGEVGEG